jgi:hypothetical protein
MLVAGTLSVGWTYELADTLRRSGLVVVCEYADPFELLLRRSLAPKDAVLVSCVQDVASVHPRIRSIVDDLARVLPPIHRDIVVVDADPHEYFFRMLAEPATMHELLCRNTVPDYVRGDVIVDTVAPPHVANTPELFGEYLSTLSANV